MTEKEIIYKDALLEMKKRVEMIKMANQKADDEVEIKGEKIDLEVKGRTIPIAYYKAKRSGAPIIIYYHGGGFCFGGYRIEDKMFDTFRNLLDCNYVSVGYALNTEFPAALNDCFDATEYLVNDESFDFDRNDISLMGSSAGANLALAVSILAYRNNSFKVKRRLLNYPYVDCNKDPEEKGVKDKNQLLQELYFAYAYAKDHDRKDPLISPIFGIEKDFDKDTESLIILAEKDILNPEGKRMAELLKSLGCKTKCLTANGMAHGYFEYGYRPLTGFVPPLIAQSAKEGILTERVEWATNEFVKFFKEGLNG